MKSYNPSLRTFISVILYVAALKAISLTPPTPQYYSSHRYSSVMAPTEDINRWRRTWLLFANGGINTYWSDCTEGDLSTRMTPQISLGGGAWLTPVFGFNLQFVGFESKADKFMEGIFTIGKPRYVLPDGRHYWKEHTKWIDLSFNLMLNLTRLVTGFEGYGSSRNSNQILLTGGLGGTHHYDLPYGSANELSFHFELGYSRFFSPEKNLSLDIRARGLFYSSSYDGVTGQHPFDSNLSLNIGITYCFTPYKRQQPTRTAASMEPVNSTPPFHPTPLKTEPTSTPPSDGLTQDASPFPFTVKFRKDRVDITDGVRYNLAQIARYINDHPQYRYIVTGYPDDPALNRSRSLWLAEHRALNICRLLVDDFYVDPSLLILDNQGSTGSPSDSPTVPSPPALLPGSCAVITVE